MEVDPNQLEWRVLDFAFVRDDATRFFRKNAPERIFLLPSQAREALKPVLERHAGILRTHLQLSIDKDEPLSRSHVKELDFIAKATSLSDTIAGHVTAVSNLILSFGAFIEVLRFKTEDFGTDEFASVALGVCIEVFSSLFGLGAMWRGPYTWFLFQDEATRAAERVRTSPAVVEFVRLQANLMAASIREGTGLLFQNVIFRDDVLPRDMWFPTVMFKPCARKDIQRRIIDTVKETSIETRTRCYPWKDEWLDGICLNLYILLENITRSSAHLWSTQTESYKRYTPFSIDHVLFPCSYPSAPDPQQPQKGLMVELALQVLRRVAGMDSSPVSNGVVLTFLQLSIRNEHRFIELAETLQPGCTRGMWVAGGRGRMVPITQLGNLFLEVESLVENINQFTRPGGDSVSSNVPRKPEPGNKRKKRNE